MSDPPASIPADWQLCNTSKSFYDTMAGYSSTEDGLWYKKVVENRHGKISEGLW
jgi:acid phosphatase